MKRAKDKTNSTQVKEVYSLWTDPLSFERNQIVFYDFPGDDLPRKTIADPECIIHEMISSGIEHLTYISDVIDLYMQESPKIKNAALPNLIPESQSGPIIWNDFRDVRQKSLNGYNIRQSSNAFARARFFPMVEFVDYNDLGCFKIIQDDCNDMVKFLVNVEKLDSHFLCCLFNNIREIEKRFYYLIGFHRMKYERSQIYKNGPGAMSREVGEQTIQLTLKVLEKYGGITGYTKLERGQKKIVRAEIEKTCHFAEERQVYNILKKIKGFTKQ